MRPRYVRDAVPIKHEGSKEDGMQNMLKNLLGGQPKRRREYDDFVNRYEQGPPRAGISDQEAIERYEEVAPHLPPEVYEESAYEAFNRMSPRERRQFAQYVRQQTRQQGAHFPDLDQDGIDDRIEQDPRVMAQIAGRMHRQQPGMSARSRAGAECALAARASNAAGAGSRRAVRRRAISSATRWRRPRSPGSPQLRSRK